MNKMLTELQKGLEKKFGKLPHDLIQTLEEVRKFVNTKA